MSLKLYMLSVMNDEKKGVLASFFRGILWVLSLLYGSAIKVISLGYSSGIRPVHKAPVPVVSVGNLTMGGTGKTPFAVFLADKAAALGRSPAILTRGYGCDENRMLSSRMPNVGVISGQDRVRSSRKAVSEGKDLIILDDGFQHRRLARDLDIVLVDGLSFGRRGYLIPRGVLREPLGALKRADIIAVTRSDMLAERDSERIKSLIGEQAPDKPLVFVMYRAVSFTDVTGQSYPVEIIKDKEAVPVSGIGCPRQFRLMIERLGAIVAQEAVFPDHHSYSRTDIEELRGKLNSGKERYLVTTRKDLVKLKDMDISAIEERLLALNISVEISEGGEHIDAGLARVINGQGV